MRGAHAHGAVCREAVPPASRHIPTRAAPASPGPHAHAQPHQPSCIGMHAALPADPSRAPRQRWGGPSRKRAEALAARDHDGPPLAAGPCRTVPVPPGAGPCGRCRSHGQTLGCVADPAWGLTDKGGPGAQESTCIGEAVGRKGEIKGRTTDRKERMNKGKYEAGSHERKGRVPPPLALGWGRHCCLSRCALCCCLSACPRACGLRRTWRHGVNKFDVQEETLTA